MLYSIVLVSTTHQYESVIGIHIYVPSQLNLPPTSVPTPPLQVVYISMMINDVEYLFMCLLAMCVSSLKNVYLGPLLIFWLGCLAFLLLNYISCLYNLDINTLAVTSFAGIFSLEVIIEWRKLHTEQYWWIISFIYSSKMGGSI